MTIATRSQTAPRSLFLLPAYTLAFALPAGALLVAYILTYLYCGSQPAVFGSSGICMGFEQLESLFSNS